MRRPAYSEAGCLFRSETIAGILAGGSGAFALQAVTAKKEWRGGAHLFALVLLSIAVGAVVGGVGASFRLALDWAADRRVLLLEWAQGTPIWGVVVVVGAIALAAAIAAWLVQWFSPDSAGSGIPHVESVLQHDVPIAPWHLIPVKFVGGVLAIGSGFALGREGPSVQIGATLGHEIGRRLGWGRMDCRSLLAAGAGAGLATAFNAPIGGSVFVLEELVRRFDTRITIVTFGASTGAIVVARLMLGSAPEFAVPGVVEPSLLVMPAFLLLGLVMGAIGVIYNKAILGMLDAADSVKRVPRWAKAAAIGAAIGLLAFFWPVAVGGGDVLTRDALHWSGSGTTVAALGALFLIRMVLSPLSYAAQTPGGLFAPLLAVGALAGVLCAPGWNAMCGHVAPGAEVDPAAMGIVAMVGLFTAVVRAPLTGIVLVSEMTVGTTLLLPMIGVCIGSMLMPTVMGNEPIYESLKLRAVRIAGERERDDRRS
ncbi:MAG: H(+)/Cl(-) exchange transporter ClcA [Phycisphaeraceae bacterium]|nr:H(+)/Cl(-) exchange transporter ClcA [Phycisphaeraceae bacterium]